jgi:DNA repair exonuclease SbcCD ATPase subunit
LLFAEEGWGYIAVMETEGLDKTGVVATTLNGGERFTVKKEVKVEGEKAYYVTMFDRKKSPSYVLFARDCYVSYDPLPNKKADPEGYAKEMAKRKKIANYYAKYATRERLRQRAIETHRKKSPHAALKKEEQNLAQVRKAIATLNERIEKNAQARKNATNAAHIRLVEEGRELRAEQGALPSQYKALKEKVEQLKQSAAAWDETHPFDETKVTRSAMWKKMTVDLETLSKELAEEGVELVNAIEPTAP